MARASATPARPMRRVRAAGLLVVLGVPLGAAAAGAQAAEPTCASPAPATIDHTAVEQCLKTASLDATDLTVTGTVDLRALGTVDHPIRCRRCHLQGDLL